MDHFRRVGKSYLPEVTKVQSNRTPSSPRRVCRLSQLDSPGPIEGYGHTAGFRASTKGHFDESKRHSRCRAWVGGFPEGESSTKKANVAERRKTFPSFVQSMQIVLPMINRVTVRSETCSFLVLCQCFPSLPGNAFRLQRAISRMSRKPRGE